MVNKIKCTFFLRGIFLYFLGILFSYLHATPYINCRAVLNQRKIALFGETFTYEDACSWYGGTVVNDSKANNMIYLRKSGTYNVDFEFAANKKIYAKDFGAKGDGITDNTAAFTSLASYCKTLNVVTTIIFEPGTYMTKEVIFEDLSDITFKGCSTKIKHIDGITTTNIFILRAVSKDCQNITIDSMYFEGGWANVLIKPINGRLMFNVNVINSSFNKTKSAALWIEYAKGVNVLNSFFKYGGDNGIYVAFSEDVLITSNNVFNCSGSGGIVSGYKDAGYRKGFEGGQNILITSNIITSDYNSGDSVNQFGIDIVMADNVTVTSNHISSREGSVKKISNGIGLQEWRVSNVRVKENSIYNIRDIGIIIGFSKIKQGYIVDNCQIQNNAIKKVNYGIRAYGSSSNITINNNSIEQTGKEGIEVGADAHNYNIDNNIFKNNSMQSIWPNPGVITVKGKNADIRNNTFIDSQCGGVLTYTGKGTFTYSIDAGGLLKIFIDNAEEKRINTTGLTWDSLKVEIQTITGTKLDLINECDNTIISGIRRTGLRHNESVQKYSLPSFITTFEPKYYIYIALTADNCKVYYNRFISNIRKLNQNQIYDSMGNRNRYDNNSTIFKNN